MRNSWAGSVSVGLLSVPVSMGSLVTESSGSALHQFAPDGGRIKIKRVSEKTGQEVAWSDIWMGYESADGTVIAVDDADLEEAFGPVSRTAQIMMFTDAASVPAIAKRAPFVIQPTKGAERAYALLAATLKAMGKVAIVEFGLRQRKRLAEISATDDGYLHLSQLEWADDIKRPDFAAPSAEFSEAELSMARQMVDGFSGDFEHAAAKDDSTAKLNALIQSRLDGTAKPKAEDVAAQRAGAALDLMAVLTASVEAARAKREQDQPKAETPAKPTKPTRTRRAATPRTRTASPVQAVPAATPTTPRRRTSAKVTATAA